MQPKRREKVVSEQKKSQLAEIRRLMKEVPVPREKFGSLCGYSREYISVMLKGNSFLNKRFVHFFKEGWNLYLEEVSGILAEITSLVDSLEED